MSYLGELVNCNSYQKLPFAISSFHGHTTSGALYYPNAMELTFACIELSAMGAKAVAKLVARRLEWIEEKVSTEKEEL